MGTGIRLASQATPEAVACIKEADKLLHLVAEPVTQRWLARLNPTAESMEDCYAPGKIRSRSYAEMVERILGFLRRGLRVCVAFYGHPGVFVQPSHAAIARARREGFPARMMPGISADACLFADLGVDPARDGCHSLDASDLLLRRRRLDPTSALVLWQVGAVGEFSVPVRGARHRHALALLQERLTAVYPRHHKVVLYEAAQYPVCEPTIRRFPLSRLARQDVGTVATLYVPPAATTYTSARLLARLDAVERAAGTTAKPRGRRGARAVSRRSGT